MKNKFIMLIGIPGSGKSTYAKHLQDDGNYLVYSSDLIRKELSGDERVQTNNNKVFNLLHKRIIESLKNGDNVVYDATNMSRRRRQGFLRNLTGIDCVKTCRVLAPTVEACKARNLERDRIVPEEVIERMANSFQIPVLGEGWDKVELAVSNKEHDFKNIFDQMVEMSHDNPHHEHSVGTHMIEAYKIADQDIKSAALLHDFGKFYTKELKDRDGKESEVARYYNHDNRGVYELLSKFYNKTIKYEGMTAFVDEETLILIQYHMFPFLHWTSDHQVKWKALLGEDIFEKLERLHEADRKAH